MAPLSCTRAQTLETVPERLYHGGGNGHADKGSALSGRQN